MIMCMNIHVRGAKTEKQKKWLGLGLGERERLQLCVYGRVCIYT